MKLFKFQIAEHATRLGEDKTCKKAKDGYIEASRALELIDTKDLVSLAETMFKGDASVLLFA